MTSNSNLGTVEYDEAPNICPVCHHSAHMTLIPVGGVVFPPNPNSYATSLQLFYCCPRTKCGIAFIAEYRNAQSPANCRVFKLRATYPRSPLPYRVSEGIEAISPSFINIANQATKAEADGLDEIAGIGFRKALEFLIKDYCATKLPDQKAEIFNASLGRCIRDFVTDVNVKQCAERAVWLGNDETHYLRKWNDKDIKDLRRLIDLTMHWMSNEHLTSQYLASMPAQGMS